MEGERQLRKVKAKLAERTEPETVVESGEDGSQMVVAASRADVDRGVQDELDIRRQLEDLQAWEKAKLASEIADYERDCEMQEQEDEARYAALQAQYAPEWDDWVLWKSMHSSSPPRTSPRKRQHLILNIQLLGDLTTATQMAVDVAPGMLVYLGMTMTVTEGESQVQQSDEARASGSQSQGSTERISPVTPDKQSEGGVIVQGRGHMTESELTSFMTGEEGHSVFQAWASGGFTAEQILRLYGNHVMEAFLANQLVLEAGRDTSS